MQLSPKMIKGVQHGLFGKGMAQLGEKARQASRAGYYKASPKIREAIRRFTASSKKAATA